MNEDEFRRRIVQSSELVHGVLSVSRTISSNVPLKISREFKEVALDGSSTYADIYRSAVSLSQYNMMLDDYAVFQYSWDSEDSWRLAYLPNPWLSGVKNAQELVDHWETLEALGSLDQEEVTSLIDELPYQGAIPAIRFEHAIAQYREISHPAAHLHIGRHSENRWAMARSLDPLTFTMMVLRLYYPESWNFKSSFHGGREDTCLERRFVKELGKMRLVHDFTKMERLSLHVTSQ